MPGVLDVSWHPDIAELYVAADVLVTDYSSSMFDFAVTGKPLSSTPTTSRPTATSTAASTSSWSRSRPARWSAPQDELAAALNDLPGVQRAYAERYRTFQQTYCVLDDGRATKRVGRFVKSQLLARRDEALARGLSAGRRALSVLAPTCAPCERGRDR